MRPRGATGKAKPPPALPADVLRVEYGEQGRSAGSIAEELGASTAHVLSELRRIGVPVREARGGTRKKAELRRALTPTYLREQLVDRRRSLDDVASDHGTSARTVARYVERLGIDLPEDVPAHGAIHKQRRSRSGSAVAKIAAAGLLAEGAPLVLDVERLPRPWRDGVRSWAADGTGRLQALWTNEDGGALVWAADRQPRSPNGLTGEIVFQAGLAFGPCQATRAWRTADGTSLADLADTTS